MKRIVSILIILSARCGNLHATDVENTTRSNSILKGVVSDFEEALYDVDMPAVKPNGILKNIVSNITDGISNVVHDIIPACVFGVKSVSMVLFTKDGPYGKNIGVDEVCDNFNPSNQVVFLVHGFLSSGNYTNSYKLSTALIEQNYTVYSLDWSDAACSTGLPLVKFLGYPSAVNNTREIGDHMAKYVTSLTEKCEVPLKNITFIGHSLGAHVCGFAAKKIKKLTNSTVTLLLAADPAKPLFANKNCDDRLCKTDAEQTIAFHTSALGLPFPVGHTDFYFNRGHLQPGCSVDIQCSHSSAVLYLAEVMKYPNCVFPGVPMPQSALSLTGKLLYKPHYPNSNTTDCIVMDHRICDESDYLDKGTYYMFVKSGPKHCVEENFNCQ